MWIVWTALSTGLFYLGALNVFFARYAGTCTHGSADRLFGITISAVLYFSAILAMRLSGRERAVLVLIAPVLPVLVWQTCFALWLSFALLILGYSACGVLEGYGHADEPIMGGDETLYAVLWPAVTVSVLIALFLVWRNRTPR